MPHSSPPKIRRNTRWWNSNWFEVAQLVAFSVGLIWLTVNGANQMGYNWQWYHMPQYFYKIIASEFYWGPLIGGGIESWLAYFIALGFLLFRPQGLFGDKIIERI